MKHQIPRGYKPLLNLKQTEQAIKLVKDFFEQNLSAELRLRRVTAPLFVEKGTGINDDLNGVERPASFPVKHLGGREVEMVQSLAKWKRMALADYRLEPGYGIYTDMNAVRPDDTIDHIHSIYVDQWDWELIMDPADRNLAYLKDIVSRIFAVLKRTEFVVWEYYPDLEPILPDTIRFIHCEEAPTGVTATTLSTTSIRLDWTDNSDNETGFRVERSTDGSSGWSEVTTTLADVMRYDDTGLAAGTTYWYRVCATSGGGDTTFSSSASATTHTDTTNPTLSVTNILDGGSWQSAAGTDSWSYQLPTGASIWKLRSSYSIEVRSKDASDNYSATFSATVTKDINKDTAGNGYADLVVGASGYSDTGKIYLYDGTSSGLSGSSSHSRLGSSGDAFGWAVAISDFDGDGYADVAVGAPAYSSYTGRVTVFYGSASGIAASGNVLATGSGTNNYFGEEFAAGDFDNDGYADLAVGASGYSTGIGLVNVYHGGGSGLSTTPEQTLTGSSNSSFGKALATGDVNNDGYDDLAVGAQGYNPGGASGTGAVYVHHGSISGISGTATTTLEGEGATNSFGVSVAIGNADGDDYDDLAVGAKGNSSSTGRVYVYHGASGGVESSLSQALDGESSNHYFGDVLSANDSNLDGYDDLVVSATNYDETYSNRGKVYLYTGSSTGIPTASEQTWIGDYTENMEYFGHSTDF